MHLFISPASPIDSEAVSLIAALDAELHARYPEMEGIGDFRPEQVVSDGVFLLARVNGHALGCGAVRRYDAVTAEVKRMYVSPEARGKGLGLHLLEALESHARRLGYQRLILETGLRQPEAIRLYEKAAYTRCSCWGAYASDPLSVCFAKEV